MQGLWCDRSLLDSPLLVLALLHSTTPGFVVVRPLLTGVCILSVIADDGTVWQIEDRIEMLPTSDRTGTTVLVVTEIHIKNLSTP